MQKGYLIGLFAGVIIIFSSAYLLSYLASQANPGIWLYLTPLVPISPLFFAVPGIKNKSVTISNISKALFAVSMISFIIFFSFVFLF